MDATDPTVAGRRPSVIVDDVRVTYREYALTTRQPMGGRILRRKVEPTQRRLFGRSPTARRSREIQALKGVSFTAYEGESIGILGRNGSGKSTLMSVIAGLLAPTSGSVFADSNPTHLGINAAFMGDLTGTQNVVLGGLAIGLSRAQIEDRFDDIVDFSGIGEFVDLPMRTYSSGMGARLKFSIATTVTHQILIIDEALSVGDEGFGRQSRKRIEELRDAAGTVFLVSHSLQQLRESCDRGIWIDSGKVVMDGPIDLVADAYHLAQDGRADIGAAKTRAAKADTPAALKKYEMASKVRTSDPAASLRLLSDAVALHLDPPAWWFFEAGERATQLEDLSESAEWYEQGLVQKLLANDIDNLSGRLRQYAEICDKIDQPSRSKAAREAARLIDDQGSDGLVNPALAQFREARKTPDLGHLAQVLRAATR